MLASVVMVAAIGVALGAQERDCSGLASPSARHSTGALITLGMPDVAPETQVVIRMTFARSGFRISLPDGNDDQVPDASNFEVLQITGVDPVTLAPTACTLAAQVREVRLTPGNTADAVTYVYLFLDRTLPPDAAFLVMADRSDRVTLQGVSTTVENDWQRVSTKPSFALAPTEASGSVRDFVVVDSNLPIADATASLVETRGTTSINIPIASRLYPRQLRNELTDDGRLPSDRFDLLHHRNTLHLYPREEFGKGRKYVLSARNLATRYPEATSSGQSNTFSGVLEAAPKNREEARAFARVFWHVTEDKKPVISFEGKLDTLWIPAGDTWWFHPNATADVGNAQSKSKNQVHANLDFSRFFNRSTRGRFVQFETVPGLRFETDKTFSKHNYLGTFTFRPGFRGFVRTRSSRRDPVSGLLPTFGYGFEFDLSAEAGRSDDRIVKNEAKTQELELPGYYVGRLLAQARVFVEIWRFTVTITDTPYFLLSDEITSSLDTTTDVVSERTVGDARNLFQLDVAFNLDDSGLFAVGSTYQRGEAPPLWEPVNVLKTTFTWIWR